MEKEIQRLNMIIDKKNQDIKDRDRTIILLEHKMKNMHKESITLKEKIRNLKNRDQELAFAMERINQLERETYMNEEENYYNEGLANMNNNIINPEYQFDSQGFPNIDNMTYEQLLELEEKIGNVERGLKQEDLDKLAVINYNKELNKIEKCAICQFDFNEEEVVRKLGCSHIYHKLCIDEWLLKDKKCPVCKIEVIF